MNTFPPPNSPPQPAPAPTSPRRRRGPIVGLAIAGAGVLAVGGFLVGTAVAGDDGGDDRTALDVTFSQVGDADVETWLDSLGPFAECLSSELDLGEIEDPSALDTADLKRLWEEGLAELEDAYSACVPELPGDLGLDVFGLPGSIPEHLDDVPFWNELKDLDLDQFFEEIEDLPLGQFSEWEKWLDLEDLDLDDMWNDLEDIDLGEFWNDLQGDGLDEALDDLTPESLEETLDDLGLGDLLDDLREEIPPEFRDLLDG